MSAATPSTISAAPSRSPQRAVLRLREDGGMWTMSAGWFQRSGVRRFVAALMLALFALSCGESLIADVCDGDELAGTATVADAGSVTPSAENDARDTRGTQWALVAHLDELADVPSDELRRSRRAKFRSMGVLAHV